MTEKDLDMVLGWRNHAEIRRYMYTRREISRDEHVRWFRGESQNPARHLLIYEDENTPLGFLSFSEINDSPVAEWGFYVSPHAPKGTGQRLGNVALSYAFNHLKVHKVYGEALGFNERSIMFHQRLGFRREGMLRDQYFDGVSYHPVFCFGLLAEEWDFINEENCS